MGVNVEQYRAAIGVFAGRGRKSDRKNGPVSDIGLQEEPFFEPSNHSPQVFKGPWKLSAICLVGFCLVIAIPTFGGSMTMMPPSRLEIELLMSGIESNPGPVSVTTEDQLNALAALIAGYDNQDTKDILTTYEPSHTYVQQMEELKKYRVPKLKSAAVELKIPDEES